jgi:hypothetical protein
MVTSAYAVSMEHGELSAQTYNTPCLLRLAHGKVTLFVVCHTQDTRRQEYFTVPHIGHTAKFQK